MIVFTFLIFFIVRSVHSETMNDLIWEKGIYYKKNTNIPFSGEINGNIKGKIQDGKKEVSLEPGIEELLGIKCYREGDTILPNSYQKLHQKKRVAATSQPLEEDKFHKSLPTGKHMSESFRSCMT